MSTIQPWTWQLWLSPRPLRRTPQSSEPRLLAANDAAVFEFLHEGGIEVVRETHYIDNQAVRDGLTAPPLHIHLRQNEYFEIEAGTLGIHRNGTEVIATKADGRLEIPAGTRHRFWIHDSSTENVVFKVWAQPQGLSSGFDEEFIRNLVGYNRDCAMAKIPPSIFQLMLFAESSATVGTPPFWVPVWILRLVHFALAYGVGYILLGYRTSYPEYSNVSETALRTNKKLR